MEALRGGATVERGRVEVQMAPERTILVRVIDRGRVGSHRTGAAETGDLDNAVRAAVAQSRARDPLPGLPHLPLANGEEAALEGLRDRDVARLDRRRVEAFVGSRRRLERARLRWTDARVAVFSSRGLRRRAAVTAAALEVRCGRGPGEGSAADAARRLQDLRPEKVFERARHRRGRAGPAELPPEPLPTLLAPEATAQLVEVLNREAFSASSYYEGTSFLREHLGIQVFDRALSLRDDATDPAGLPFPFDLEGTPKYPVNLVDRGTPKTPALDQRQAAVLGLPPTAHAIAGADARAENLFLLPGEADREALLGLADGGLWTGRIDPLECFEPTRVQVRAVLRGVRRIRDGRLAETLPDLVWETSLLRAFSNVDGIGARTVRRLGRDGYLGGISTPGIVLRVPNSELSIKNEESTPRRGGSTPDAPLG